MKWYIYFTPDNLFRPEYRLLKVTGDPKAFGHFLNAGRNDRPWFGSGGRIVRIGPFTKDETARILEMDSIYL